MAPVAAHRHRIMHPSTQAQALRQLRQQPTWKLLSAENGPAVMALIQAHLLEGPRRLPASLLVERLGRDLERFRAEGWDLPQPASAYLADWLAAGWLERGLSADGEEEYEASAAAAQAIRFAQELSSQRTVATESRLGLVIGQLAQLAEETEPDPAIRAERLLRERERLDARIAAVRAGRLEPLPADRALERLKEILSLSDELASDFRRVRDDFRSLNRDLRERIVDNDGSRGDVLDAVFADVDLIADSDEHIAALLAARGQVTVAELLAEYPAEQGLGTVVGYLALGLRDGIVAEGTERVSWRGRDGIERSARIPRVYFVSEPGQRPGSAAGATNGLARQDQHLYEPYDAAPGENSSPQINANRRK